MKIGKWAFLALLGITLGIAIVGCTSQEDKCSDRAHTFYNECVSEGNDPTVCAAAANGLYKQCMGLTNFRTSTMMSWLLLCRRT